MAYTTDDFAESLHRAGIPVASIASVVSAWGSGSGMGDEPDHYRWAEESKTDWSGGFLLHLQDGTYLYLTGWCDYTGWGCQDGVYVYPFQTRPSVSEMRDAAQKEYGYNAPEKDEEWDPEPADLNRWLGLETAKAAE